ncbi:hypothetical protein Pcinc_033255 [Petrolisthes cinctipes]|uniref:Neurotransmitter-gated ion-channel ligand-binding domain-containing protein n=1 Tax=Petrolisthes cinctipes TaxID=88211 RepID=A0AAE1ESH7_PETCI|nr:hypothetical protein Pcinc_033255 [Petrolisthes cinctipes]
MVTTTTPSTGEGAGGRRRGLRREKTAVKWCLFLVATLAGVVGGQDAPGSSTTTGGGGGGGARGMMDNPSDLTTPGVLLGPGYSRLCKTTLSPPIQNTPGLRTTTTGEGFSSVDDSEAKSTNGNIGRHNINKQPGGSSSSPPSPSFTVCAFIRIHKLPSNSIPLFSYTGLTWRVSVEVSRLGVGVQVVDVGEEPQQYFFEARLPLESWRHLCLSYHHTHRQMSCYVDGTPEALSSRVLSGLTEEEEEEEKETGEASGGNTDISAPWRSLNSDRTERTCVGGSTGGKINLARLMLWRGNVNTKMLIHGSGCEGRGDRVTPSPLLVLDDQWESEGETAMLDFSTRELCGGDDVWMVVTPAGIYTQHRTVCQVLGGDLLPSGVQASPDLLRVARGDSDSCVGLGGLMTWMSGGRTGTERVKVTAEDECPVLGTGGLMNAACVRQLQCSMCVVNNGTAFLLYGHDGRLFDHTYYLNVDEAGIATFEGMGGSNIMRKDSGWVLLSRLHQQQWVLVEAALPIGRQKWMTDNSELNEKKLKKPVEGVSVDGKFLTLTACRTTEFACDNGQCVPHTARCDEITHCNDRSDEADCQVVQRVGGYDPYYPPPPRPNEVVPMDLTYRVDVYSMDDVTTEGGQATMNVGMTLTWYDPRITFIDLKPKVKNYFSCDLIWTPSVRAVSGHGEGTVLETTDYDKFCFAFANDHTARRPLSDPFMGHQAKGKSHSIENYVGVFASVPCHFQLQMYPFDFQLCNISFMIMNAPWTRVFRRDQKGSTVPYLNSRRVLLEYVLEDVTTEVGSFLQGTDNNTYFALTFHLRRLYGYHVTNSFFPSLLMFLISFATFYFQASWLHYF